MIKKNWWNDGEFKDLLRITRDESRRKLERERAWEKIMNDFVIPMCKQKLKTWKISRVDPWEIASEIVNPLRNYDIEKNKSSYSYFLTCITHALGECARRNAWCETTLMQQINLNEEDIPEGYYEAARDKKRGMARVAAINHRADPYVDRMHFMEDASFITEHCLQDLYGTQTIARTDTLSVWEPIETPTMVESMLALTETSIRDVCPTDWMVPIVWDYVQQTQTKLRINKDSKEYPFPVWTPFEQSTRLFFAVSLNDSDRDIIHAVIAKALKKART